VSKLIQTARYFLGGSFQSFFLLICRGTRFHLILSIIMSSSISIAMLKIMKKDECSVDLAPEP